ncbi:hypothetical protein H9P43_004099 [Blastocladiella emersonii ATCC 22665]|nr:hypothetical protein H9P43_004099 [Blastocladiella emersonii ATCC 22665]
MSSSKDALGVPAAVSGSGSGTGNTARRRHKRSKSTSDARRSPLAHLSPTKSGRGPTTTHSSSASSAHSSPARRAVPRAAVGAGSDSTDALPVFGDASAPLLAADGSPAASDPAPASTHGSPTARRLVHSSTPIVRDKHRRAASFSSISRSRSGTRDASGHSGTLDSLEAGGSSGEDLAAEEEFHPTSRAPAQDWFAGGGVYVDGPTIRDAFGRTLQLRGVNLCGSSKLPTTPHADNPEHPEFYDTRNVSFIGRPLPLEDAHEHFSRLSHWGLTFVRLLVPWEALEHAGPGIYDEAYIDYLIKLCELMPKYGIRCFIDPHQDVWSRFSGGSGAPGWTFEVAGLDIRKFKATGAAHVHNAHVAGHCDCTVDPVTGVYTPNAKADASKTHGDLPHQPMLWPTNYTKLASATMFTLFFAGATFAPNRCIDGENIQHYLQRHYFAAYRHLAARVRHLDAVLGFEVMNEPHQGYVGLHSLERFDPMEALLLGDNPSALQSFCLGLGLEQEVEVWVKSWPIPSRKHSTRVLNAEGVRVWLPGYTCPWLEEGVYAFPDPEEYAGQPPEVLKPDYFTKHPRTKQAVDFNQDFYLPFINMYAVAIQQAFPDALILAEPIPQELPPVFTQQVPNLVYAPHWYDLKSVFSKAFDGFITHDVPALRVSRNLIAATYFGLQGAKRNYANQLRKLHATGKERVGNVPCVIGECGIPMDLNRRAAFDTGNYAHHNNFLDAVISAMEANLLHFTLWNYNPGNDNTHGDYWNGEDFSIFSPRQGVQYSLKSEERRNRRKNKIKAFALDPKVASAAAAAGASAGKRRGGGSAVAASSGSSSSGGEESAMARPSERSKLLTIPKDRDLSASAGSPVSPNTPFDITELFFNEDLQHHMGGRVLDAVIRPYAARVAGTPTKMEFDLKTLSFRLEFTTHKVKLQKDGMTGAYFKWLTTELPEECYETVVYVPKYHYGYESLVVSVSDGTWAYYKGEQTLFWRIHDAVPGGHHWLQLGVKSAPASPKSAGGKARNACARMLDGWCTVS